MHACWAFVAENYSWAQYYLVSTVELRSLGFGVWGQMFILLHPYQLVLTRGYLHVLWDHLAEKRAVREVLTCQLLALLSSLHSYHWMFGVRSVSESGQVRMSFLQVVDECIREIACMHVCAHLLLQSAPLQFVFCMLGIEIILFCPPTQGSRLIKNFVPTHIDT